MQTGQDTETLTTKSIGRVAWFISKTKGDDLLRQMLYPILVALAQKQLTVDEVTEPLSNCFGSFALTTKPNKSIDVSFLLSQRMEVAAKRFTIGLAMAAIALIFIVTDLFDSSKSMGVAGYVSLIYCSTLELWFSKSYISQLSNYAMTGRKHKTFTVLAVASLIQLLITIGIAVNLRSEYSTEVIGLVIVGINAVSSYVKANGWRKQYELVVETHRRQQEEITDAVLTTLNSVQYIVGFDNRHYDDVLKKLYKQILSFHYSFDVNTVFDSFPILDY